MLVFGSTEIGDHAGHTDDRTTRLAGHRASLHMTTGFAHGPERAVEIDAHDATVGLTTNIEKGFFILGDTGVGKAGVDTSHRRHQFIHRGNHRALIGHIDPTRNDAATMDSHFLFSGRIFFRISAPDDDIGTGLRQRLYHAEADAAIAAGY
jgi:hypothetical protein